MPIDTQIHLFERKKIKKAAEFIPLEAHSYDWKTPAILCMGGVDGTVPSAASGFAKIAENMLGDSLRKDKCIRFFSMVYPKCVEYHQEHICNLTTLTQEDQTHPRVALAQIFVEQIVKDFFKPHIENVFKQSDHPVKKLAEDFNKLTIFSYSLGSYVTPYIHEVLKQEFNQYNIGKEQVTQLLNHIHVLSFGDCGIWQAQPKEGWDFSSLHMASIQDVFMQEASGLRDQGDCWINLKHKPHIGLIINHLATEEKILSAVKDYRNQAHHPATYAIREKNPSGEFTASDILKTALVNMVCRDEKRCKSIFDLVHKNVAETGKNTANSQESHHQSRLETERAVANNRRFQFNKWPDRWVREIMALDKHKKGCGSPENRSI